MNYPITRLILANDSDLVRLRRGARVIADTVGLTPQDQTRMITAISEVARNALQYAEGGVIDFGVRENSDDRTLTVTVSDEGLGIHNVQTKMKTKPEGDSLGIAGAQKLVDHFSLDTGSNGTVVQLAMALPRTRRPESAQELASRAVEAVSNAYADDPHEELVRQNRALMESLSEKDFLMREIHHRVKNNFQLISSLARLQAGRAKGEEARVLLESLAVRIRALGLAHEQLYRFEDISRVSFRDFLTALGGSLEAAFVAPDQHIKINSEVHDDAILDQDDALNLGLVVNELVTNSVKHGFPNGQSGEIVIVGAVEDMQGTVSVQDNGVGDVDFARKIMDSDSLGMRLLQGSVRKIGGEMEIGEREGGGLSVSVTFPLRAQQRASTKQ